MKCRHCTSELTLPLVDLGSAPPSNSYLTGLNLHAPEKWFPLRVLVCEQCWLVQTATLVRQMSCSMPTMHTSAASPPAGLRIQALRCRHDCLVGLE